MWEQSSEAREQGKPIDLPHYESSDDGESAEPGADRAFSELGLTRAGSHRTTLVSVLVELGGS